MPSALNLKTVIIGNKLDFIRNAETGIIHSLTGTCATSSASDQVTGTGTAFLTEVEVGDLLTIGAVVGAVVESIESDTALTLTASAGATVSTVASTLSGPARRVLKPNTTAANWARNIGDIEDASINPNIETEKVYKPNPGAYVLKEVLGKQVSLTIELTINDLSVLISELLFANSAAVTDAGSGSGVPLSASGVLRGWFRFRQYDSGNTLRHTAYLWASVNLGATNFNQSVAKPKLTLDVLQSDAASFLADFNTV